MLLKNRVLWSDNGVIKDLSDQMNNHISGSFTLPIVAAQDYIYFGAEAPFNHRWIEIKVANTLASTIQVALWDGSKWVDVAASYDQTLDTAGTKTLSQSGRLIWVPNKQKTSWSRDDTKDSGNSTIDGLGSVIIYDLYWARLKFSGDLSATTELNFIGYKFANDEDLYGLYPNFDTTESRDRFKDGLTTFDQIHFEAAKEIIRDLKGQQVIDSENQIIEWEILRTPAIHKAAELIFNAYGSDYEKERAEARNRYKDAAKVELFNVDVNANASLDVGELGYRSGRLLR